MKFKNGVYPEVVVYQRGKKKRLKISEKTERALEIADALSKALIDKEIVVTSLLDGGHGEGSEHYDGNAGDIRRWLYKGRTLLLFVGNLRENLGDDYDVVLENTHIHIEYDPKKN